MSGGARIAGAPISSWGIIEIPDWGYQMPAERVLREAASLGLAAIEAGPEDLLPREPAEVSKVLAKYELSAPGVRDRRGAGRDALRRTTPVRTLLVGRSSFWPSPSPAKARAPDLSGVVSRENHDSLLTMKI